MAETVQSAVRRFQRGLAHSSRMEAFKGYRALLAIGPATLPVLEANVLQGDWRKIKHTEAIRSLVGHVSLIHDIDEARSRALIDTLLARGCDRGVRVTLEGIRAFTRDDYQVSDVGGVEVRIDKGLPDHEGVLGYVSAWLEAVPADDLGELDRITLVPRTEPADASGYYVPALSRVMVVWYSWNDGPDVLARISRLSTKWTLYHEIGHHRHRHVFGQDPDQEAEADRYAWMLFRTMYPRAMWIFGVLIRFLRRMLRWRRPNRRRYESYARTMN